MTQTEETDQQASNASEARCHHNGQYFSPDEFLKHACRDCFRFLYDFNANIRSFQHHNASAVRSVCETTHDDECEYNLMQCCQDAEDCCAMQLQQWQPVVETTTVWSATSHTAAAGGNVAPQCPQTWDGYSCINASYPGKVDLPCPRFVAGFHSHESAYKVCLANGNWQQRTEYGLCSGIYKETILSDVTFISYSISFLLLLVSLIIFVSYRVLRRQPRIRIHINLFISLILHASWSMVACYLFELQIYHNIATTRVQTLNPPWCRIISISKRFFLNATFLWVLCEALFLHRLLTQTFNQDKTSVVPYVLFGWGAPTLMNGIYYLVRVFHADLEKFNIKCWVEEPSLEWMLRAPNLLFLVVNLAFMVKILSILRNLPQQHNDRNSFRRWMRAIVILMPLFGLQWCFVFLRLDPKNYAYFPYTFMQNLVLGSQGGIVSIIFCLGNQEVRGYIKRSFDRYRQRRGGSTMGTSQPSRPPSYRQNKSISASISSRVSATSRRRTSDSHLRSAALPLLKFISRRRGQDLADQQPGMNVEENNDIALAAVSPLLPDLVSDAEAAARAGSSTAMVEDHLL